MAMAWMRMPGQTWPSAAASFLGVWAAMMVPMMLPSLLPSLWRYRQAVVRTAVGWPGALTTLVGLGYFFVWTVIGMVTFPFGVALASVEMHHPALARATPVAIGVVVLIAGAMQFTAWKAHHLACWRESLSRGRVLPDRAVTAWRHGVGLGLGCGRSSGNLMMVLLVTGIMDVGAMTAVAAAITVERLAPAGARVARVTGVVVVAGAVLLIVRGGFC